MTKRDLAYKWRRKHGRLALVGFHVDDPGWIEKLIELDRLSPAQEDDRAAIREATIRFIDDIVVAERR